MQGKGGKAEGGGEEEERGDKRDGVKRSRKV
jgi:hypothetical protein